MSEDVKVDWIEIYGLIASKCFMARGTAKIHQVLEAGKILQCRTALLRSCYKQERFYNAELLCEKVVTSRKDFTMQNCC
jgi:hypothetical protein